VVDFAYLEGFAAGDRTVVKEVLKLFRASYDDWRARLVAEAPDWREAAHTIKGAGRGIGAFTLGDACEKAETEGPGQLPALRAELDAAMAEIDTYLASA
jgi:HPt (histidine-containing phosphotransfer) domain-containing protein